MTGRAYLQSAKIAAAIGPYDRYAENREAHNNVMRMHRDASYAVPDGVVADQPSAGPRRARPGTRRSPPASSTATATRRPTVLAPARSSWPADAISTSRRWSAFGRSTSPTCAKLQDLDVEVATDEDNGRTRYVDARVRHLDRRRRLRSSTAVPETPTHSRPAWSTSSCRRGRERRGLASSPRATTGVPIGRLRARADGRVSRRQRGAAPIRRPVRTAINQRHPSPTPRRIDASSPAASSSATSWTTARATWRRST